MSRKLKLAIDSGDVDRVRKVLAENISLASSLISWGPLLCPCKSEPLHYLCDAPFNQLWNHGKQAEMAKVLLEAGAPADGLPTSGETPLHGAASLGEFEVAEVLIHHGANIEAVANYRGIPHGTPLDFAVHFGMVDVVDLLIQRGAAVLSTRMAAGGGQLDRVREDFLRLDSGNQRDVMRCAAVCDRIEVVQFFIESDVSVATDLDGHGATMLHWAAWEAKVRMVEFLLSHGADPTSTDGIYNLTPYGWAKHRQRELGPRWGHERVMELLEAF